MSVVGIRIPISRGIASAPLKAGFVVLAPLVVGDAVVNQTGRLRLGVALLVLSVLLLITFIHRSHAIVPLFAFLAVMGLIRRLLIPVAGWSSHDPLLLIGPVFVAFLFFDQYVRQRRSLAPDRLSRFVLALSVLVLIESINPLNGSLLAGFGGLLFVGVPLLWFFVGRELASRSLVTGLLALPVVIGTGVACYGLYQTNHGFPSWDRSWISITGYGALTLGHSTRAFGTMASGAEYAYYIAMGLVVAIVAALHGRILALVFVPILGWALLLEGSRAIIVLVAAAAFAVVGLRAGGRFGMVMAICAGVALVFIGAQKYGTAIAASTSPTNDPLVSHVANGLLHPLNSNVSSLPGKLNTTVYAVRLGIRNPVGYGTSSSNIAGAKFGGRSGPGEEDLPNVVYSLGIVGGLIFVGIVLMALRRAIALYVRSTDVVAGGALAILLVTLGQWWNGGYYSVCPLVWLLIGWVCHEQPRARRKRVRARAA